MSIYNLKTNFIIEVLETILGSFIMALSVSLFLLPNELSSGGFSGIATIVYYTLNIPVGMTMLILNIPLFVFGMFKMGKKFFSKAVVGVASISIFTDYLGKFQAFTDDKILACIYGGVLTGLGTALILRASSSTGGSDLLSILIKEYKPNLRTGNLITIIDLVVVFLNVIVLRKIEIGLYSVITIYVMGKVIDIIFEGIYFTKLVFIISDKSEEIYKKIQKDVKRGVTGLSGQGMYTGSKKLILMCAVGRNDLGKLKMIIKNIDKNAFLIITNSREVLGVGFKGQ